MRRNWTVRGEGKLEGASWQVDFRSEGEGGRGGLGKMEKWWDC